MIKLNRRSAILGTIAFGGLALGAVQLFVVDLIGLNKAPKSTEVRQSSSAVDLTGLNDPPTFGEMTLGPDSAKVTIIEYASATCPHCAAFHNNTFITLKKEYIDTGKIRFVFREYPHQDAALAAFMVARCAPKEKYFPLIDVFFLTQPEWTQNPQEGLYKIARQAGFTKESFEACLKNEVVKNDILAVRTKAEGFGVTGIPTFFVNGERYEGENTIEAFRAKIDPLLV